MTPEQRKEIEATLPWRVEESNVALGDTGDYEGLTQLIFGNGGEPVAEIWNAEDYQADRLRYIADVVNGQPALLSALDAAEARAEAAEERVRELEKALEMSWAYLDQLTKDGMRLPNIDIVQGSNLAALKAQGSGE